MSKRVYCVRCWCCYNVYWRWAVGVVREEMIVVRDQEGCRDSRGTMHVLWWAPRRDPNQGLFYVRICWFISEDPWRPQWRRWHTLNQRIAISGYFWQQMQCCNACQTLFFIMDFACVSWNGKKKCHWSRRSEESSVVVEFLTWASREPVQKELSKLQTETLDQKQSTGSYWTSYAGPK